MHFIHIFIHNSIDLILLAINMKIINIGVISETARLWNKVDSDYSESKMRSHKYICRFARRQPDNSAAQMSNNV